MTRVFPIHGSTSLHLPGAQDARIKRNHQVKGSFELSNLCDKEFHKMAQNFGMIANYGKPKDKIKSTTIGTTKQPKEHPAEPEAQKPRVRSSNPKEATVEEEKTSTI
jgi:hypothetical protein